MLYIRPVSETQSWIEFWNSIVAWKTIWSFKNYFLHTFVMKKPLKQWKLGLIWSSKCCNVHNIYLFLLINVLPLFFFPHCFWSKLRKNLTTTNVSQFFMYNCKFCWLLRNVDYNQIIQKIEKQKTRNRRNAKCWVVFNTFMTPTSVFIL